MQALMLPGAEISGWVDHFCFGFAHKHSHIVGAPGNAQTTTNAVLHIHHRVTIPFCDGVHMAACDTGSTVVAGYRINDRVIVGKCHRLFQAEFCNATQDATTATTAIADITHTLCNIVDSVNQSNFFTTVQQSQGFGLGKVTRARRGAFALRKTQAHVDWKIAGFTNLRLSEPGRCSPAR